MIWDTHPEVRRGKASSAEMGKWFVDQVGTPLTAAEASRIALRAEAEDVSVILGASAVLRAKEHNTLGNGERLDFPVGQE